MAGKRLSVALTLNDKQFQSGLRKATKSMTKFGRSMQRTGRNLSRNLTLPIAAFGAASVAAFDKQAKAIAQVDAGLRSTGQTVGFTSQQLQKMASDLQAKTLFGDEVILKDATAQLLTFTNITGEQFAKTQMAALNLATRLDGDLKSASIQLGKALNDPVANLSALSRSGIQFSEEQKAVIKSLAETNRLADAQNIILEELEKQYGGSAEAAAQAGAGPLLQLKNRLGDLTEDIGRLLLPMLVKLAEGLKSIMTAFNNLSPEGKRLTVVIGLLVAGIGPMLTLFGSLSIVFSKIVAVVGVLSIKFIAIAAAVAALALGVVYVVDNWEAFKERFTDISWWKNTLISMIQTLVEYNPVSNLIKGFNSILEFFGKNPLPNPFEKMADGLEELKVDTKDYENDFQDFGTFITNQGKKIKNVLSGIGDAFNVGAPSGGGGGGGESKPQKFNKDDLNFGLDFGEEEEVDPLPFDTEEVVAKLKNMEEWGEKVASSFQSAFHSMAASADASFKDIAAAAGNAARQVIKTQVAEATAAYAAKIFSTVPFPFNLALAAAAGSVVGSLFNKIIPPFAEGGMVSGATLAMVGEGPGTSAINPEVIAPLDKLQGMIGNAGGGQVEVVGKISGSDILLASDRARGNRTRTRGY